MNVLPEYLSGTYFLVALFFILLCSVVRNGDQIIAETESIM